MPDETPTKATIDVKTIVTALASVLVAGGGAGAWSHSESAKQEARIVERLDSLQRQQNQIVMILNKKLDVFVVEQPSPFE